MIQDVVTGTGIYLQLSRFILVMILGVLLTRAVLMPLVRKAVSRKDDKKLKHSAENLTGLLGLFTTFIVALQSASFGSLVTVLGTVAAAATVAVGFGMRDQVSSVVSGIFIHTDNPFVKGDYIKVGDTEGVIQEIGLRATVLNGGNSKQIVPNNLLTGNVVENFSKGARTSASINLSFEPAKVEKASELLLQTVEEHQAILKKPEPRVRKKGIDDGKLSLKLEYWMRDSAEFKQIRSEVIGEFNRRAVAEGLFEKNEEAEK